MAAEFQTSYIDVNEPNEEKKTKIRDWKLKLTVGLVEDIKDTTKIDLDELIAEPRKISEFVFTSPRKLVELLWILCEDQAKQYNVTPREFGRMFDRDILDKATDAFLEAIILFYPRTSVGGVLQANLPTMLRDMDRKLTEQTIAKLKETLSTMPTDLPES